MIKIICVGKIKEKYLVDAINEYKKRISKYTNLEIIEIQDENFDEIEKIKKVEAEKINKYINKKDYIITLEINATELTSMDLASKMEKINIEYSNITFIIGGSYGLHEEITNQEPEYEYEYEEIEEK